MRRTVDNITKEIPAQLQKVCLTYFNILTSNNITGMRT